MNPSALSQHSPASVASSAASIPPPYGFHNLDRRTILLSDGNFRSYFSLPPDFSFEPLIERFENLIPSLAAPLPPLIPQLPPTNSHPLIIPPGVNERERGGVGVSEIQKRKLEQSDGPGPGPRHRRSVRDSDGIVCDSRLSKQLKVGGEGSGDAAAPRVVVPDVLLEVDKKALMISFLKFTKRINEDLWLKSCYLADGKNGSLKCLVCSDRISRDFKSVHALLNHAFNAKTIEFRADHLGLHKALCVLMGWNYMKNPDNKANIPLSSDEAQANREDLIVWPPSVIIHNASAGKQKNGCAEGFGNKGMDTKLKELGFVGGKVKPVYCESHIGVTMVKFANTLDGLKEAERLAEFFEKDNHGRKGWTLVQAHSGVDNKNRGLVQIDEKAGEKRMIFYGYLATAFDLDKVDLDMKKNSVIKSRKELDISG